MQADAVYIHFVYILNAFYTSEHTIYIPLLLDFFLLLPSLRASLFLDFSISVHSLFICSNEKNSGRKKTFYFLFENKMISMR